MVFISSVIIKLRDRQILIILTSIILLALLLRIYALSAESLWSDEILSIDTAKESIASIIEMAGSERSVHPPFYYIILHFWMKLFGDSEFSVRFPSVIFGVASIYVIYRVGKLIYSEDVGMVSAFLLSISLFHIRYSQEARFYALLAFLVLSSNFYFVRLLKEKNIKNAGTYIILTTMMAYTHVFGLFYIIFQNIYYFLVYKKNIKFWIATQCAILLIFAPWIPYLIKQTTKVVDVGLYMMPPLTFLSPYYTLKLFAGSEINLFIFLAIAGIISNQIFLHEVNDRIFLLLWLIIPILIAFELSMILQPFYVSRYVIGSLPALILLVSKGIFEIRKSLLILTLLIILTVSAIFSLEAYYNIPEKTQWREAASYVENYKGNNDFVFFITGAIVPFSHYYNDSNFAVIYKVDQIMNLTKGHDGIWLVSYPRYWWTPERENESKLIEKTLTQICVKQYTINFVDINLSYYLISRYEVDQSQLNQSKIIQLKGNYTKLAQCITPEILNETK